MLIDLPLTAEEVVYVTNNAKQQGIEVTELMANAIRKDMPFYYDRERMDKAIASPRVEVPKSALKDFETFEKWLDGAL
ncbi:MULTISPECIES: hypothetical protein [unclassified Moraxella]|uniref:hypothetical protein n=1 Tax=unclassified Moraxella TaxID=2685852 RepID=UPI003AF73CD9